VQASTGLPRNHVPLTEHLAQPNVESAARRRVGQIMADESAGFCCQVPANPALRC